MLFSSQVFLFHFLPVVLAAYYLLPRRAKLPALTLLSYVFYGWANPLFVPLLLLSTAINYGFGLLVAVPSGGSVAGPTPVLEKGTPRGLRPRLALVAALGANLALLGVFKALRFGGGSPLGEFPEMRVDLWSRLVFPLGLSFYTFQGMSYVIDVYRGDARAMRNPVDFACFAAMFPKLLAGPIVRAGELGDGRLSPALSAERFSRGIACFALGLGKKVLLANPCGTVADTVFGTAGVSAADAWYGVGAFALQIFYDISGYSDMAVGLGLMLGFAFPDNVDSPYRSASVTEFWRRWHRTLSAWFRDYVYIPLGGSRRGELRASVNLMAVMLLGALWHGVTWGFAVWGAIHGAALVAERFVRRRNPGKRLPRFLGVAGTGFVVLVSWVFFRARDLPHAMTLLKTMAGMGQASVSADLAAGVVWRPYFVLTVAVGAALLWMLPNTGSLTRRLNGPKSVGAVVVLLLAVPVLTTQPYYPFLYFMF